MKKFIPKQFSPGVQHIYVRANDWGVIFYDDIDRLVFYTIQSVAKRKCGIKLLAASYMYTHAHTTAVIGKKEIMSDFIWKATSPFARAYNHSKKRSGAVFHRRFGWASKKTEKQIRNNICYVVNNHVEKRLCRRAAESRWDFIAYATSSHPFSKAIVSPSPWLKHAMYITTKRNKRNLSLNYEHLTSMFSKLDESESEQLTDYIISTYKLVDFDKTVKYFKGYEEMLVAPDLVTGNEYDINEEYSNAPDTGYVEILSHLKKCRRLDSIFTIDAEEQLVLINDLSRFTNASMDHIAKALHIPITTE